jgi:TRAP-type C4-dicarboxylate transport system permease small subunit
MASGIQQGAQALKRLSLAVAKVELVAAQALIVVFTGLILVNVFRRYAFNRPLFFAEELSVYILIWMAFLAIAVTIARRETISLTFLVDNLPPRARWACALAAETLVAMMLGGMVYAAWVWFNNPAIAFERALTLGQPKWPFLLIIPLFCSLAFFHAVANVIDLAVNGERKAAS